jgi:hypothetical protein
MLDENKEVRDAMVLGEGVRQRKLQRAHSSQRLEMKVEG